MHSTIPFELARRGHTELMWKMSSFIMILPMLMLVECQGASAILILVDTVLSFLTQLKQVINRSFDQQIFPYVQASDFALCIYHQDLKRKN